MINLHGLTKTGKTKVWSWAWKTGYGLDPVLLHFIACSSWSWCCKCYKEGNFATKKTYVFMYNAQLAAPMLANVDDIDSFLIAIG